MPFPQPTSLPYTYNIPTYAPRFRQLQTFDGTNYQERAGKFINAIKTRTVYHLGLKSMNSEQCRFGNFQKITFVDISFDGLAYFCLNSFSETDNQDLSNISAESFEQFDCGNKKNQSSK